MLGARPSPRSDRPTKVRRWKCPFFRILGHWVGTDAFSQYSGPRPGYCSAMRTLVGRLTARKTSPSCFDRFPVLISFLIWAFSSSDTSFRAQGPQERMVSRGKHRSLLRFFFFCRPGNRRGLFRCGLLVPLAQPSRITPSRKTPLAMHHSFTHSKTCQPAGSYAPTERTKPMETGHVPYLLVLSSPLRS